MLSLSVAWQAYVQDAPHLYITAAIAFAFKAIIIPIALHRIIAQLGIQRDVENVVGIGPTMLAGLALVALSDGRDAARRRARPTRWRARTSPSRCRSCCSAC